MWCNPSWHSGVLREVLWRSVPPRAGEQLRTREDPRHHGPFSQAKEVAAQAPGMVATPYIDG